MSIEVHAVYEGEFVEVKAGENAIVFEGGQANVRKDGFAFVLDGGVVTVQPGGRAVGSGTITYAEQIKQDLTPTV